MNNDIDITGSDEMLRLWHERQRIRSSNKSNFDPKKHLLINLEDCMNRAVEWVRSRPFTMVGLFATEQGDVFFEIFSRVDEFKEKTTNVKIRPLLYFGQSIFTDINRIGYKKMFESAKENLKDMNHDLIKPDSDGILYDMRLIDVLNDKAEEMANIAKEMIEGHEKNA